MDICHAAAPVAGWKQSAPSRARLLWRGRREKCAQRHSVELGVVVHQTITCAAYANALLVAFYRDATTDMKTDIDLTKMLQMLSDRKEHKP